METRDWRARPIAGAILASAAVAMAGLAAPAGWAGNPTARAAEEAGLTDEQLLGKRIFEDVSLSEPAGVSCASCHDPARAFQGNNGRPGPVAAGSRPGLASNRNTPTLTYAAFVPPFAFVNKKDEETGKTEKVPAGGLFWDGRAPDLAHQALGPLLNPREMNNPDGQAVVRKVRLSQYGELALRVLGQSVLESSPAAALRLGQAVAAYERTPVFNSFSSKFDDVLRGRAKFTAVEAKGFALFKDPKKGNCIACHVGKESSRRPQDWMFTDFTYDVLGVPRNAAIPDNMDPGFRDPGLCGREDLARLAPKGFDVKDVCGAFRVPTLRNVAVTAPYMHNGAFATLREAVDFYFTRDTNPERWYPSGTKFDDLRPDWRENANVKEVPYDRKPGEQPRATPEEIDVLVAFLQTLTDRRWVDAMSATQ